MANKAIIANKTFKLCIANISFLVFKIFALYKLFTKIENLPNRTVRELAIDIAKDRFEHPYDSISHMFSNQNFRIVDRKERLLTMILGLYMKNFEGKTGASYFLKSIDDKSIKYHRLFWNIYFFNQYFDESSDFWIEIYENAVTKHKYIPNNNIVEEYNKYKSQV